MSHNQLKSNRVIPFHTVIVKSQTVVMSQSQQSQSSQELLDDEENNRITQLFTINNSQSLIERFKNRTDEICSFATAVFRIGNDYIAGYDPVHITNTAMRECLEEHDSWSKHTSGGYRSMTIKFEHNTVILAHQVKQYKKYEAANDDDPWKKKIDEGVTSSVCDTFAEFFKGTRQAPFSLLNNILL